MRTADQVSNVNNFGYANISWSSIFAGVLITVVVSAIFNLLGMSIGFSLFQPTSDMLPVLTWSMIVWLSISSFLSMYIGGWVTSYYGFENTRLGGILSGILTGSVALILFFVVTASISGTIISSSFSALNKMIETSASGIEASSSMMGNAAKGINKVAPELSENVKQAIPDLNPIIEKINKKANELLPQNAGENSEEKAKKIKAQLGKFIGKYLDAIGKEDGSTEEVNKEFSAFLVENTGKSPEEINQTLEEWKKTYVEAKEKARVKMLETSEKISKALSHLALINFFIIILSLIAAAMGGLNGLRTREQGL